MNERQLKILQALIERFVASASPVGSSALLETEQFHFSGATLRNEMAALERLGLLSHPHTSAGRVPTAQGYRLYVNELINRDLSRRRLLNMLAQKQALHHLKDARKKLHNAVSLLSEASGVLAFATFPENNQTLFLGVANVLRQPEFIENPEVASNVIEIIEKDFHQILENAQIEDQLRIFIGEENLIPNFTSCSMLALRYHLPAGHGILGLLGPMRMDYGFNAALLEHISENLKEF